MLDFLDGLLVGLAKGFSVGILHGFFNSTWLSLVYDLFVGLTEGFFDGILYGFFDGTQLDFLDGFLLDLTEGFFMASRIIFLMVLG